MWVIGAGKKVNGGYGIYRWQGGSTKAHYKGKARGAWKKVPGAAVRIAMGPGKANAWVVNSDGYVFNYKNNRWSRKSNKNSAKDIGVGSEGTVWVIGTNKEN